MNQSLMIGQILTLSKFADKYLEIKIDKNEKREKGESLYFLIEIDSPYEEVIQIAKKIIEMIRSEFFALDGDLEERFEKSLKKTNLFLAELSQQGNKNWIGKLNSIICTISNDSLVITSTGNAKSYLFRAGNFSQIIEDEEQTQPALKTYGSLVSGSIKPSDKLLFTTQGLINNVPFHKIKQIVNDFDPITAVNEIASILKHQKTKDVNLMLVESVPKEKAAYSPPEDKKPIVYLDQKEPSALTKIFNFKSAKEKIRKTDFRVQRNASKSIGLFLKKLLTNLGYYVIWIGRQLKLGSKDFQETKRNIVKENIRKKAQYKDWENFIEKPQKSSFASIFFKSIFIFIGKLFITLFKPENRKKLIGLLVIIVIIVVFFVTRSLTTGSANNGQFSKFENDLLTSIDNNIAQAKLNISLGKKDIAKTQLEQALSDAQKLSDGDKKNKLLNTINENLDLINGVLRIKTTEMISTDASAIKLTSASLVLSNNNLYDFKTNGQIYLTDISKKDLQNIANVDSKKYGKVKNVKQISDMFIILTENEKILEFNISTKEISEASLEIGDWPKAIDLDIYAKRMYLLAPYDNQIYRHVQTPTAWQKPQGIITSDLDLSSYYSVAIDGDVYLLNDNEIKKIIFGKVDDRFKLTGVDFTKIVPLKIYTNDTINNLYVLTDKGSILQLTKDGQYQREIVIDNQKINSFYFADNNVLYISTDKGLEKIGI